MIDFTKPVQCVDGTPATIITTEGRGVCPVLFYLGEETSVRSAHADGTSQYLPDIYSLINVPEPRTYWVRIDGPSYIYAWADLLRDPADATHRITICGDDAKIERIKP